jgi:hypothetical protein
VRDHDVSRLTADELERARRELAASLALARPGSPIRAPIEAHMAAIDAELAERARRPAPTDRAVRSGRCGMSGKSQGEHPILSAISWCAGDGATGIDLHIAMDAAVRRVPQGTAGG